MYTLLYLSLSPCLPLELRLIRDRGLGLLYSLCSLHLEHVSSINTYSVFNFKKKTVEKNKQIDIPNKYKVMMLRFWEG